MTELRIEASGNAMDFCQVERRFDLLCALLEEGWDEARASVREVIRVVVENAEDLSPDHPLMQKWARLSFSQQLSLICLYGHLNDD